MAEATSDTALLARQCKGCGADISGAHGRRIWCSVECRNRHRVRGDRSGEYRKRVRRRPPPAPILSITYTCKMCGEGYHPKRPERRSFCSRSCSYRFQALKKAALKRVVFTVSRGICDWCGARYNVKSSSHKFCSFECQDKERYQAVLDGYEPVTFKCAECGRTKTTEYGDKSRIYCGLVCLKRAARRASKQARRARRSASMVEPVSAFKVFARDGWRCHLCGVRTLKRLRGTTDDRAPELDHIVPLAKGGEHSYRNTACACRRCNIEKSDAMLGQLRLFG